MANPESTDPPASEVPASHQEVAHQKLLVACASLEERPLTVDRAVELAQLRPSHLVLLHVIEIPRAELNPAVFAALDGPQSRIDARRQAARERLESLAKKVRTPAVSCEVSVRFGVPYEEILSEADRMAPDYIIVGHRTDSVLGHFLLGSTAERVVRHARFSTVVVRQPAEAHDSGDAVRRETLPESSQVQAAFPPPTPFNYPNL